jgi:hypothetical protein
MTRWRMPVKFNARKYRILTKMETALILEGVIQIKFGIASSKSRFTGLNSTLSPSPFGVVSSRLAYLRNY